MVELFAAGLFSRAPSLVIGPVARVATCRLPTTAKVERAERTFVPNPPEGLADAIGLTPLSTAAGPAAQSVPVARLPPVSWDRSCRLTLGELYLQQPPSNRTSVSRRIRLYVPPTWRLMRPPP